MKRLSVFLLIPVFLLLAACGPKEIGYGLAEEPAKGYHGAPTAEVMRYPLTGASNTQRLLYQANRPAVMEQVQKWNLAQYRKSLGLEPEQQEVPEQESRQPSVFRQ